MRSCMRDARQLLVALGSPEPMSSDTVLPPPLTHMTTNAIQSPERAPSCAERTRYTNAKTNVD
jgi:hypothetical protein